MHSASKSKENFSKITILRYSAKFCNVSFGGHKHKWFPLQRNHKSILEFVMFFIAELIDLRYFLNILPVSSHGFHQFRYEITVNFYAPLHMGISDQYTGCSLTFFSGRKVIFQYRSSLDYLRVSKTFGQRLQVF